MVGNGQAKAGLRGLVLAAGVAAAVGARGEALKNGTVVPDGTNVWIGAASGGFMADAANWRAESAAGYTAAELLRRHCVYDLRGLADGAVVTNDLTAGNVYGDTGSGYKTARFTLVAGVIAAGAPGDTWTVQQGGGTGLYLCNPCALDIEGGCLVWADKAGDMYPYKVPHKYGTGTFRLAAQSEFWETEGVVHAGTLVFTNNVSTKCYRWQVMDGATLEIAGGATAIAQIRSPGNVSAATRLAIPSGATLDLCTGFNNFISSSSFAGDVTGAGTLRITGGGRHAFARSAAEALAFTGLWQPYHGGLVLGSAAKPLGVSPASSFDVPGAGWAFLYQDATIRALTGAGADGGVSWPADATLTLDGAAGATNVYAGRLAGGAFVKKGAGHALVLTGETRHTGALRVEAGTLAVRRGLVRPGLRAYWNFEDADDLGADVSAGGLMPLAFLSDTTFRPYPVVDGAVGRALHFGDGQSMKDGGRLLRARTGDLAAKGGRLPRGNEAFTFSFWMRPAKGKCGNGTNFLHIDGANGAKTTEQGEATYDVGWGNGFFFGSVKWDEEKGKAGSQLSAFKSLGFYCGTGWTRGGAWNDAGDQKIYSNKVAIATFDDPDYLFDGNWHHVVGTYSNRVMRLFVDGQLRAERLRDGDLAVSSNPYVSFGNFAGDTVHTYQGDLDEIQWLAGAWSAADVAAEYAARDPRAARAALLPAPVAHWTFDEQTADRGYADVTGNGFALENVASNGTAFVGREAVAYADDPSFAGGAAVIKAKTSHLRLKEGADLGARLTDSFTISLRALYPANGNFFMLGDGTAAGSVYLGDGSCPRMPFWTVGGTKLSYADSGILFQEVASKAAVRPLGYSLLTLVYDAEKKEITAWRDATLQVRKAGVAFALKPTRLQWGVVGDTSFANLRLDDLRLYDTALDGAQVAELARVVRRGAGAAETTVLPPEAAVEVAAGATFATQGAVDCALGAVAGAGRLDIGGGTTLRAADYAAFSGTVAGAGALALDGAARVPAAARVTADVRLASPRLSVADAGRAEPFVTTTGRVLVPATGRITFPDAAGPGALAGKRWTLAKGASVVVPDDLSGWTLVPAPPAGWTFKVEDGALVLSAGGGGTCLLLR